MLYLINLFFSCSSLFWWQWFYLSSDLEDWVESRFHRFLYFTQYYSSTLLTLSSFLRTLFYLHSLENRRNKAGIVFLFQLLNNFIDFPSIFEPIYLWLKLTLKPKINCHNQITNNYNLITSNTHFSFCLVSIAILFNYLFFNNFFINYIVWMVLCYYRYEILCFLGIFESLKFEVYSWLLEPLLFI